MKKHPKEIFVEIDGDEYSEFLCDAGLTTLWNYPKHLKIRENEIGFIMIGKNSILKRRVRLIFIPKNE